MLVSRHQATSVFHAINNGIKAMYGTGTAFLDALQHRFANEQILMPCPTERRLPPRRVKRSPSCHAWQPLQTDFVFFHHIAPLIITATKAL